MNLSELLEEKRKNNSLLKGNYFPKSKAKAIALVNISDKNIVDKLLEGLNVIPANFVFISNEEIKSEYQNIVFIKKYPIDIESGFDFIIADNEVDNLKNFITKGITPIISENNYLSSMLEEFNPIKVSGNSYLYKEENEWCIFYAIIRYLENYKFPYDNRNLIKNLLEI
ncbi:MAG: hypothetical protein PHG82_02735 [Candidatus Gracilibacteria bacterium]|nr:hypothetical protein [Candidatus Gracilibacteria bacterium]